MPNDAPTAAEAARHARLAAALRANLQRRKLRDRATAEPPAADQTDSGRSHAK